MLNKHINLYIFSDLILIKLLTKAKEVYICAIILIRLYLSKIKFNPIKINQF